MRAVLGLALFLGACGGTATSRVELTLTEYAIAVAPASVPAGSVTLAARNAGTMIHEVVVVRTELAPNALPVDANGSVIEDGLDILGEIEDVEAGESGSLTVELTPGRYVLFCNVLDHYRRGMATALTVR